MGVVFSQIQSKWSAPAHDTAPLPGKVYVVTGGLTGIGYHTSLHLALRGATVYASVRNPTRGDRIAQEMAVEFPATKDRIIPFECDFSTFQQTKDAAERVLEMIGKKRLDGLVNNAGRLANDGPYGLSPDGIEWLVQINHFGPVVFTQMLLPRLVEASQDPKADIRIVNVASNAGMMAPKTWRFVSADTFNATLASPGQENSFMSKFRRYGTSKMLNIAWTTELQRRLDAEGSNITALCLHPGGVGTDKAMATMPLASLMTALLILTPSQGALTTLFALTSPVVVAKKELYKGSYIHPYGKIVKSENPQVADPDVARKLWDVTEEVVAAGGIAKTTDRRDP